MFGFISADNRFHVWAATKGFLLSDESIKQLLSFKTLDDCVNWLYLNNYKQQARELNKAIKESK